MKSIVEILKKYLHESNVPEYCLDAKVILLFMGDWTNIENYKSNSFLRHLYKLFTKILTTRLTLKFAFRNGFSTIEHLQTIRALSVNCVWILPVSKRKYNISVRMAFIHFHKAFRNLWKMQATTPGKPHLSKTYKNVSVGMWAVWPLSPPPLS